MNLKEIKELIELVSDKEFAEFEIERQGFRLRISRFPEASPQIIHAAPTPLGIPGAAQPDRQLGVIEAQTASAVSGERATESTEETAAEQKKELQFIKALTLGTFYNAPKPGAEPFVRIGSRVEPDTVVCIIEAMKMMNEIQAEISGEIVEIYVKNEHPVEYGQKLFGVKSVVSSP